METKVWNAIKVKVGKEGGEEWEQERREKKSVGRCVSLGQ